MCVLGGGGLIGTGRGFRPVWVIGIGGGGKEGV